MNETSERPFSGYLKIITKRWWLFLLLPLVTIAAIFIINASSPSEYVAYERLQIIPSDSLQVPLFSKTPMLTTAQQVQSVHDDFYDVIRLPSVAWKTIADLGLSMSADELVKRINTQHQSEFITVSARMFSPELAAEVVTTHTQNAIDAFRKVRVTPAEATLSFLNEQVTAQEQALAKARDDLQKFQLEHEVSDLPNEIAAAQDYQRRLTAERDRLRTESARAEALAAQYQQQADENNDKVARLRSELTATAAITGTASLSNTTTAPDSQISELSALAANQAGKAQEQLAIAAGHQAAIQNYDRILNEREQQIIFLLGLQDQYADLVSAVHNAQGSYDFLVDKTNEARLKMAQGSEGYLEVVTPARQPNAPIPHNTFQLILVGALASLLLGLLLAFLLEMIERGVGETKQTPWAAARRE